MDVLVLECELPKCSITWSTVVGLFGKVVEPLGDRASLKEVGPWGWVLMSYILAPLPVCSLLPNYM